MPPPADNTAAPPDLFTAFQEQLGLKLESTKAPAEVFVIDRVEKKPDTENAGAASRLSFAIDCAGAAHRVPEPLDLVGLLAQQDVDQVPRPE